MKKEYIGFDIESTGTSTTKDRIVSISIIIVDEYLYTIGKKKFLINPTIPIPKEATEVHGITNEMVVNQPTFKDLSTIIYNLFFGKTLIGYNIKKFDIPLLIEELLRCEITLDVPKNKIIDACVIFHKNEPRTLGGALKFYCGYTNKQLEESDLHDAENDNEKTLEVLRSQLFFYDYTSLEQARLFCQNEFEKENFVDFEGKIVLNEHGVACYSFGKDKGKSIKENPGFGEWMLRQDFSNNTKNVIISIINSK